MHEAALRADEDPYTLATLGASWQSFLHALRVLRCKLPLLAAFPPFRHRLALHKQVLDEILEKRMASSRSRQVLHEVKRKMSGHPLRPRTPQPTTWIDVAAATQIAK